MSVQGLPQSCWVSLSLRTVRGTKLKARFGGGRGRTGHGTPGVAPPALGRGEGLSWPSGDTSPRSHLGSTGMRLTHVQLGVHLDSQGLFCQATFQLVFPPRCRTLHLWNFCRFLSAISPACWSLPGWQREPLVIQPLSVLCCLRICWGCTLTHHPSH